MSYSQFKTLKKGTYKEVVINSKITKGSMTYADLLIKGKSKKEILLTSYKRILLWRQRTFWTMLVNIYS